MQITDDIILMAYLGKPMPDLLTGAEALYYMAMVGLGTNYRNGLVNIVTAKQLKHQIMNAYELAKFNMRLNQYHIDIIKATSFIACDVRKNPDAMAIPCVAKLISALDGVIPVGADKEAK